MSGFFIAINRHGEPFSQALAQKMLGQLDHFGADGKELVVRNNFAIGYQRHWTVPQEQGERQPLYDKPLDLWLVLHGRLDNRPELYSMISASNAEQLSDAGLLLELYRETGTANFKNLKGPFALVLFMPNEEKVIAARDAMGGRYLVYRISGEHLLISTYEMPLAAHPAVGYRFKEQKLISFFANLMDDVPTSTIADLQVLLPGHLLELNGCEHALSKFYLPDPRARVTFDTDQQYATEFRRLLDQAVARRLRSIKPIGVMLSGGMDSVPIAISAALQLRPNQHQLQAFSWVFDKHPQADERHYSEQVCQDYDITPNWVLCDDVWPAFDADTHQNPIVPFSTPYSEFNQQLFKIAKEQDVGVLLSGIGGDMLYTGTEPILYELLRAGRFRDLVRETKLLFLATANGTQFIKRYVLLPLIGRWLELWRVGRLYRIDFLSDSAQRQLRPRLSWLRQLKWRSRRPQQYQNVVGAFEGEDAAYGKYMEAKYQLERRYPLRDRDLAEFMLAIPSDQLFAQLQARPIVKSAFADELPKQLLQRNSKTDFSAVIEAGIKRDKRSSQWLQSNHADWQRLVKNCFFDQSSADNLRLNTVKWRCAYYEFWNSSCYTAVATKLGSNDEN